MFGFAFDWFGLVEFEVAGLGCFVSALLLDFGIGFGLVCCVSVVYLLLLLGLGLGGLGFLLCCCLVAFPSISFGCVR